MINFSRKGAYLNSKIPSVYALHYTAFLGEKDTDNEPFSECEVYIS